MFAQVQRRHHENLARHGGGNEILNFDGVEMPAVKRHWVFQRDSRVTVAGFRPRHGRRSVKQDVAVDVSEHGDLQTQPLARLDVILAAQVQPAQVTGAALFDLETHHVGHAAGANKAVYRVVVAPAERLALLAEVPREKFGREALRQEQLGEVEVAAQDDLVFLVARQQTGAGDAVLGELESVHAPEAHEADDVVHLLSHFRLVVAMHAAPAHQRLVQIHLAHAKFGQFENLLEHGDGGAEPALGGHDAADFCFNRLESK